MYIAALMIALRKYDFIFLFPASHDITIILCVSSVLSGGAPEEEQSGRK